MLTTNIKPEKTAKINFGAKYSIRGYVGGLSCNEYRIITGKIKRIGSDNDLIDIFIPNTDKAPDGVIGMAGYVGGKLRTFNGPYEDGDVFNGIMKGLRFAKNHLYRSELSHYDKRYVAELQPEKKNPFSLKKLLNKLINNN